MQKPIDIRIQGQGFYSITALSDEGREWLEENVPDQTDGQAYSDSRRCTEEIAEGATGEGLTVSVDGFEYLSGGLRGEELTEAAEIAYKSGAGNAYNKILALIPAATTEQGGE